MHVIHVHFMFFAVFKNNHLKSSFSEDNMPVHARDVFLEKVTKMVRIIPLKICESKFKVAPKLCIYSRQGMSIG